MSTPYFVFEVTPNCNLNCIYCYNHWRTPGAIVPKELGLDKIKTLVDKLLSETQIAGITLSGGEPLMRKDIVDIAKYIGSKNIPLGMTTNGLLLNEKLTRDLVKAGVSYFEVSIDSLEKNTLRQLDENSNLAKIKQAVLNIRATNTRLNISTIITKINVNDIPTVIDLAYAFGANSLSLNRFALGGTGSQHKDKLMLSIPELKNILDMANQKSMELDFPINFTIPIEQCLIPHSNYPNLKFATCVCADVKWVISPDGFLRTCEQNPDIIGSLFENSFEELANSEAVNIFRLDNFKPDCSSKKCFSVCGGGCRFTRI